MLTHSGEFRKNHSVGMGGEGGESANIRLN